MVASPAARTSTTGTRTSPKRSVVLDVVRESDAFRSAQEIHHVLRGRGARVGLSTVYRNLQALAAEHEVDTLRNEEGEVLYRRCGVSHHHHLVCRECGRVEEIRGPAVERWAARAADQHGFTDVEHTAEVFGICPDCAS
jgi:Fur family ferric uptake transcriptional regulator